MSQKHLNEWWSCSLQRLQEHSCAAPLKKASLSEDLSHWTKLTTEAVVRTCESLGWEATARGHRGSRLPESASEYLSLDAMAFPKQTNTVVPWPLPSAVFELENSPRNERVGYSLWKVLCVRSPLRMVYAYRRDWELTRNLMDYLTSTVVASLTPAERIVIDGETAVVTGSRGESETFPHGYFKLWLLDTNLGKFERI